MCAPRLKKQGSVAKAPGVFAGLALLLQSSDAIFAAMAVLDDVEELATVGPRRGRRGTGKNVGCGQLDRSLVYLVSASRREVGQTRTRARVDESAGQKWAEKGGDCPASRARQGCHGEKHDERTD